MKFRRWRCAPSCTSGFSIGIDDDHPRGSPVSHRRDDDDANDRVEELIEAYENERTRESPRPDDRRDPRDEDYAGARVRDNAGNIADEHFEDDNPAVVMANPVPADRCST